MIQKIFNGYTLGKIILLRRLRRLMGKPIVHVFGDSHTLAFQNPLFQQHYLGPVTAYNLGNETSSTQAMYQIRTVLNKLPTQKTHALFVFGEIDARIHIYNQHKKTSKMIPDIIADTVSKYLTAIHKIKREYPNITAYVFNVVPPGEQENVYQYPHYATRNERLAITRHFNQILEASSKELGVPFIQVFDELLENDLRKQKFIHDDIHFNNEIMQFIIPQLTKYAL